MVLGRQMCAEGTGIPDDNTTAQKDAEAGLWLVTHRGTDAGREGGQTKKNQVAPAITIGQPFGPAKAYP